MEHGCKCMQLCSPRIQAWDQIYRLAEVDSCMAAWPGWLKVERMPVVIGTQSDYCGGSFSFSYF